MIEFNKLAVLQSEFKELTNRYETLVIDVFKEYFELCPEVEQVALPYYAPSFNDGSPCYPRFGELEVEITGDVSNKRGKVIDELNSKLTTLLTAPGFGDQYFDLNTRLVATRDGDIVLEDYDCGY